jgi:hypothetical protein
LEGDGAAVVDDPIGTGAKKFVVRGGGTQSEYVRARGFAGADSSGGVLNHNAIGGRNGEGGGAAKIWLGVRLAAADIVGSD